MINEKDGRTMIGMQTKLNVADNSGAKVIQCINTLGGDTSKRGAIGDLIRASVKEAAPQGDVEKGSLVTAVIVRMKKEMRRETGTYIRFDENAAVLIDENGEPVGTRVFGPIARELRDKKFMKIVSLAPEVL